MAMTGFNVLLMLNEVEGSTTDTSIPSIVSVPATSQPFYLFNLFCICADTIGEVDDLCDLIRAGTSASDMLMVIRTHVTLQPGLCFDDFGIHSMQTGTFRVVDFVNNSLGLTGSYRAVGTYSVRKLKYYPASNFNIIGGFAIGDYTRSTGSFTILKKSYESSSISNNEIFLSGQSTKSCLSYEIPDLYGTGDTCGVIYIPVLTPTEVVLLTFNVTDPGASFAPVFSFTDTRFSQCQPYISIRNQFQPIVAYTVTSIFNTSAPAAFSITSSPAGPVTGVLSVTTNESYSVYPSATTDSTNHTVPVSITGTGPTRSVSFTMPSEDITIRFIIRLNRTPTTDGNNEGGTSIPDTENTGTFDLTSDSIPLGPLPSGFGINSGFVNLYVATQQQLQDLSDYMWSEWWQVWDNFVKLFSNPMDYFISLHMLPYQPTTGTAGTVKMGWLPTNVTMSPVINQYEQFDFGTVSVDEYWGSALDYAPNTQISLFLPFIGSVQLDTDEVMGHTVGLIYRVDNLSGSCVAVVTIDGSVAYQYTGECAVSLPMTGSDWSRVYGAVIGTVGAIAVGSFAVSGATKAIQAAGSYMGINAANSVANNGNAFALVNATSKGVPGVASMRQSLTQAAASMADLSQQGGSIASFQNAAAKAGIARTARNTVNEVMGGKVGVLHTGNIAGVGGVLGNLTPYLLIKFPNQSLADNYKHFVGYPANLGGQLGNFVGFTQCEQVFLSGNTGTEPETAELINILKEGVYL